MSRLFRKSFLNHFDNQQELSQVLPERAFNFYYPLVGIMSFALLSILIWLFFAEIEVHVKAKGMVLPIGGVRESVSLGEGRIIRSYDYPDGKIESGDPLIELSNPVAEQEYFAEKKIYQTQLLELEANQASVFSEFTKQSELLNNKGRYIKAKSDGLLEVQKELGKVLSNYRLASNESLKTQQADLETIKLSYQQYLDKLDKLKQKGFASDATLIPVLSKYESLAQSLASLKQQSPKIDLDLSKEHQLLLTLENDLNQEIINLQKNEFELSKATFTRDKAQAKIAHKKEQAIQKLISLEHKMWIESHIFTEYDGRLLDTKKRVGQVLKKGETVSIMSVDTQMEKRMLILSPKVRKGKVTFNIDNEEFEVEINHSLPSKADFLIAFMQKLSQHSSINDVKMKDDTIVFSFSGRELQLLHYSIKSQSNTPVFASLQTVGENWGNNDLVNIAILRYQDAKLVKQGDEALIKPLYEKTLIGAKLRARVEKVSPFALTQVQSYSLVGNQDLATTLIGSQPGEVVLLTPNKTPENDYDWGGRKPIRPISAGVPTTTTITIDNVPPIEIIIPYIARIFINDDK